METAEASKILFSGTLLRSDYLSNDIELAKACPEFFKKNNSWSGYATKLFAGQGGNISNWKWKTDDKIERTQQMSCLKAIFRAFILSKEEKEAVAGWMLSEMLGELPEYIPKR